MLVGSDVSIQASAQSVPSTPAWFGEVTVIAYFLRHLGMLTALEERVRFVRRRFGHHDLIDFAVVLLGYAISGERTLEAFYERLQPFLVTRSWLCSGGNASRIAQRSVAFLLHPTKRRSRRYACCFSKIW